MVQHVDHIANPSRVPLRSPTRTVLICLAIACNALCAGGVYSFPLMSPALVAHMKFTQSQLTTIALAGMVGQYPFAAIVGKVKDSYGARVCSLIASAMFVLGFGLFAHEISQTPENLPAPSLLSFWKLVLYFGTVGLASVFSYFSTVFSATQTFPEYMGVAAGTSMALFGCSPLILSALGEHYFTHPDIGLNVTQFLTFLAILTGLTHWVSAFFLPGPTPQRASATDLDEAGSSNEPYTPQSTDSAEISERQPLLGDSNGKLSYVHSVPVPEPQQGSSVDLLRDPYFWVLVLIHMVLVGGCETVMTNLGSMFLSLPPSSPYPASIATQVQLLSLSNTATRLLVGPIADLVSPVAAYLANGVWSFPRKQYISRIAFLLGGSLLLILTFAWLETSVRTREALWLVCVGVGIVYGTTFTVLPGILSSIWGHENLGRNFGIISYAPFVGTSAFSYLYAFIAERNTPPGETICTGVECWAPTYAVCIAMLVLTAGWAGILWRAWRGRV